MLTKFLLAVLNGVITFIVLLIIVAVLNRLGLSDISAPIASYAWIISVLVGLLTFLGVIPNYWNKIVK